MPRSRLNYLLGILILAFANVVNATAPPKSEMNAKWMRVTGCPDKRANGYYERKTKPDGRPTVTWIRTLDLNRQKTGLDEEQDVVWRITYFPQGLSFTSSVASGPFWSVMHQPFAPKWHIDPVVTTHNGIEFDTHSTMYIAEWENSPLPPVYPWKVWYFHKNTYEFIKDGRTMLTHWNSSKQEWEYDMKVELKEPPRDSSTPTHGGQQGEETQEGAPTRRSSSSFADLLGQLSPATFDEFSPRVMDTVMTPPSLEHLKTADFGTFSEPESPRSHGSGETCPLQTCPCSEAPNPWTESTFHKIWSEFNTKLEAHKREVQRSDNQVADLRQKLANALGMIAQLQHRVAELEQRHH